MGILLQAFFAQRFAMLHPEVIDTLCVGGASGSIPVPIMEFDYPIGIKNFETITGKKFSLDHYKQIKFRYYVGALEDKRKRLDSYDEDNNPVPMHDMSYFERSVPFLVGQKQRDVFGRNLFERSINEISFMKKMNIDIEQVIFKNRTHNNYNGIGVNELADRFISKTYNSILISASDGE